MFELVLIVIILVGVLLAVAFIGGALRPWETLLSGLKLPELPKFTLSLPKAGHVEWRTAGGEVVSEEEWQEQFKAEIESTYESIERIKESIEKVEPIIQKEPIYLSPTLTGHVMTVTEENAECLPPPPTGYFEPTDRIKATVIGRFEPSGRY